MYVMISKVFIKKQSSNIILSSGSRSICIESVKALNYIFYTNSICVVVRIERKEIHVTFSRRKNNLVTIITQFLVTTS